MSEKNMTHGHRMSPPGDYHVTLVTDATAAFSAGRMHAAHVLNGPTFAHAMVTTAELVAAVLAKETVS